MSNNHLIIGLGGTGGKVIRDLRKTIERSKDASGNILSDARFEFLYIDTNSDEMNKDEWKVLGKEIDLAPTQHMINHASDALPVLGNLGAYPGLKDWIGEYKEFAKFTAATAGASQRRKLGRLVFALNAPAYLKRVEDRLDVLSGPGGKIGATIHVVCGLAGGTGSGSVVDAVTLIRHKYPDPNQYRILIYAMLPDKDSPRVTDVTDFSAYYANGYAALSELNALAIGKYKPTNLLDGSILDHQIYFNGCYLVNNINENGVKFGVESEVPRVIAEFIFQKTMNTEWQGLSMAEKGENHSQDFESDGDIDKARSKRFLSFGITRLVVPEQEIREYMAYCFAEQVARQLMFNTFEQGVGYAGEIKEWKTDVRNPDTRKNMLLSDAHLTLEIGILKADQDANWRSPIEYWTDIVSHLVPIIVKDQTIEQTLWISQLRGRFKKVFDETYRSMGGVLKFYEVKGKSSRDIALHIRRHIENQLFAWWKSGKNSSFELRKYTEELITELDERLGKFTNDLTKIPDQKNSIDTSIIKISSQFNNVGFFGKIFTDNRGAMFSEIGNRLRDLYILMTVEEGLKFACSLIPFVKEQLVNLRGAIDELHQSLVNATKQINFEFGSRLGSVDAVYQMRLFNKFDVDNILKVLITDESGQLSRTQKVRHSLINLAGTNVDSFVQMQGISLGSVISTLSQQSAEIVQMAHSEISKSLPPVLGVNIVERLQKKYDANSSGLKTYVHELYIQAGNMIVFNKNQVDMVIANDVGGTKGKIQTIGVFLPECENKNDFRSSLENIFREQDSNISMNVGKFNNQIIIMKITSLMPVRFVDSLDYLKRHYTGLLANSTQAILLHSRGDGKDLPPLFARSIDEINTETRRKPYRLVARLLGMIGERKNKTTGEMEWAFSYLMDDLPTSVLLSGKSWTDIIEGNQPSNVQATIEKEVNKRLEAEYKHLDKKTELNKAYKEMALACFKESGQDDQDPNYISLKEMKKPLFEIIGLPYQEG